LYDHLPGTAYFLAKGDRFFIDHSGGVLPIMGMLVGMFVRWIISLYSRGFPS
jgi:hypothetical protein